jgi:hypothetical protein
VFPVFLNLWPAHVPTWDLERSLLPTDWLFQYGQQPKSLLTSLMAPFRLSLAGKMDFPSNYDGVLGVFFLAGLPLLFAARRHLPSGLKVAASRTRTIVQWCRGQGQGSRSGRSQSGRYTTEPTACRAHVCAPSCGAESGEKRKGKNFLLCVFVSLW